jgi:hypothetical protein
MNIWKNHHVKELMLIQVNKLCKILDAFILKAKVLVAKTNLHSHYDLQRAEICLSKFIPNLVSMRSLRHHLGFIAR